MTHERPRPTPSTAPLLAWIFLRRCENDWSIRELARRSGVSPTMISRIELGLCSPDLAVVQKLFAVLSLKLKVVGVPEE